MKTVRTQSKRFIFRTIQRTAWRFRQLIIYLHGDEMITITLISSLIKYYALIAANTRIVHTAYCQFSLIRSAAFSPIMNAIELVWPAGMTGMIDVSTTRRPLIPRTLNLGSTTASGSESGPILHVPAWWWRLVDICPVAHHQYASDLNVSCSQPGNGIGNSLDPYFWNAWVSLTAIACLRKKTYFFFK